MTDLQSQSEHTKGVYYALAAFLMWGLVPVYFKSVAHISPVEVIVHRVIWSAVFLLLFICLTRRLGDLIALFQRPSVLYGLALSAAVISVNWLVFIWAVSQNMIVEATLGYFINPLISMIFGMVFFAERLRMMQWMAIALAAVGVLMQVILLGHLPWVALVLATSFAIYGALRKKIPVDSITGLLMETLWLTPIALSYMGWLYSQDQLQIISASAETVYLLMCAGIVTSLPLMAFAAGARRLSLTLIGLLQYIGPSIAFLLAVFYYDEPMDSQRLLTFVLIWTALAIFSAESILFQRRKRHPRIPLAQEA
ncbi:EamA family transporter RarD [Neptuniibacter halophilus]|uniref:EamA family transporter RarD n=1 Tax=Neptuniibacter halophilus TaxID=651666 RepID=UPI002573CBB5|nr:EamA family transporter RarD [Neptuniibacter halophilus]